MGNQPDVVPLPLARRSDFRMGLVTIRPSVRLIEGPQGSAVAEPRVMQVLLAFIDAGSAVLTRDDLIRGCWGGAIVGEDAVNRTIAEIRRIARSTAAGFGLETIPKVGYRLTGYEVPVTLESSPEAAALSTSPRSRFSRRGIVSGAVATGLVCAAGLWWRVRQTDPRFAEMMEQGRQALRLAMPGAERQAVGAFQKAVALKPEDAAAWGLLALAQRSLADFSAQQDAAIANLAAEQAARRALELDPREPHALLTRMQMQRAPRLDWLDMEKELRRILAIDPANPKVLDILVALLQAAGYTRESWDLNEKAITLDGLRPDPQHRKALKLWILGRPDEADQQAAFVMQNWPLNNLVRGTRLLISTFTGRFRAASLLIEDPNTARILSTPGILMYTTALAALESHAPSAVSRARSACLAAAPAGPALSVHAVMLLSALNEVDAAYDVIEGFLLRRGLLVTRERSGPVTEYESDIRWRNTQWLFTPATKPLRGDPRFAPLCDVIGLDKYWNGRGVQPDERRQA